MATNGCTIHYTTTNGKVANIRESEFDANVLSHTYEKEGILVFDKPISKIRDAFYECKTLVSITLPDTINNFSRYAFWGCDNLQEFNHKFSSQDKRCLINSKGVLITFAPGNITEYTVPSNATQIGGGAFRYSKLTKINIPNSVQIIGLCAFQNCATLCEVIMDYGILEICQSAFSNCKNLKHIVIPDSLIKVADYAFVGCKSLSSFDSNLTTQDKRCLLIDGTLVAFATAGITDYIFPEEVTSYQQTVFDYTVLPLYVQGSIDLILETKDNKLILVDYKTDRINKNEIKNPELLAKRMAEKHKNQLLCYAKAVKELFGREADEIYIYSLPAGAALPVLSVQEKDPVIH